MEFEENKPIYLQIVDGICERVLNGTFKAGERIPSVREWAATIGVNPNTVARAYDTMAGRNIIFNTRGIGFSVAENAVEVILAEARRKFVEEEFPAVRKRAELLGINLNELIK